uniref:Zinc finger PHD-type domain-containing protein n=1 Tax=Amphimedon queenslandica TaxID=400682 RepID=A0A1X7SWB7_AMPQE
MDEKKAKKDMEMALMEQRKTEREKRKAEKEAQKLIIKPSKFIFSTLKSKGSSPQPSLNTRGKSNCTSSTNSKGSSLNPLLVHVVNLKVHLVLILKVHLLNPLSSYGKSNGTSSTNSKGYCWCGGKDIGKIIVCDNVLCETEWFHYECLGISCAPKGA